MVILDLSGKEVPNNWDNLQFQQQKQHSHSFFVGKILNNQDIPQIFTIIAINQ